MNGALLKSGDPAILSFKRFEVHPVTEITLFDATTRLSELIDLLHTGEEIAITRDGNVVARLILPDDGPDQAKARIAIAGLRAARERATLGKLNVRSLIEEGRR